MILMNLAPSPALRRVAALALASGLLLAGCGGPLGGRSGDGPRVVGSFYPLAYVAERVAGKHGDVVDLTSPGVEPHDLELNVKQTAAVADADVVVYEKGMQPAVDQAVTQNGPDHVVEAAGAVGLEGQDLHFWLDPERMVKLAARVRAELAAVDPKNAADYKANFEALRKDLLGLDRAYREGLADCKIDTVVVSHDAFEYLRKYGLHFEPIAGLTPDAEPSAAHLKQIGDLVRSEGITTVFSETLASPALAQTLARDLGVKTAVLDPIEGLGKATAGQNYLSLMRKNLQELRSADQCR
jgi:zinc transport system substrate-binding protein